MVWSFPIVDDDGAEYGGEVSFRFKDLSAIEKMSKWNYTRLENGEREERRELVEGCATIHIGRDEYNVKANYDELLAKFKEYSELFS